MHNGSYLQNKLGIFINLFQFTNRFGIGPNLC